ncbi:MAG: hypothetical protein F9K40_03000 [Kofleriaceae bacterium]|nr:MAG: hypothetical protein F9K40_03000 [Kofleriaceae bacterium]MBZ0232875.1 hypothetical protein [Kofleriaceae bacterium]
MRKLATIALLALSLLTVACTESEDADTDFEAASIDEPTDLAMDGDTDTLIERAPGGGLPSTDRFDDGVERAPHQPGAEPLADRIGPTDRDVAPGQPATGTAECPTVTKLSSNEPVIGIASDELGARARERFDQMAKIRGLR